MSYTWIDLIILAIFFINIGMGLMRGLFREVIAFIALVFAFVVTIKYTAPLAAFLYQTQGTKDVIFVVAKYIANPEGVVGGDITQILAIFTYGISFLLLFVGSYSILEAVCQLVPIDVLAVAGTTMTLTYRLLGGALGFIRGFAFTVVFIFVLNLSPIKQTDVWYHSILIPTFMPAVYQLTNYLGGGP